MLSRIKEIFKYSKLNGRELANHFLKIYNKNIFGGKESISGEGSNMIQTLEIRKQLPKLIREYKISSFIDAPCGDWFWMRNTELNVDKYIGVDIVEPLIEVNKINFTSENVSFQCLDIVQDALPQIDLIFCRDCLVHLSDEHVLRVIENFKKSKSKYLLTTTFPDQTENSDLGKKIWRTLNLTLPPFNFPEPIKLINEKCTEADSKFSDKSLGLWLLEDL